MDTKDKILIITNIVGWTLAIVFFVLKRRHDKTDRALEKRLDVYSSFLKKADEVNEGMRTDPNAMYGVSTEHFSEIINNSGDEQKINDALVKFNEKLIVQLRQSIKPLQILNSEVNSLTLVASDELLLKIREFKDISTDLSNEFQNVLSNISAKDSADMVKRLETLGHDSRNAKYQEIYQDMIALMRKEIKFFSQ